MTSVDAVTAISAILDAHRLNGHGGLCLCGYTDQQSHTIPTAGSEGLVTTPNATYLYACTPAGHRAHVATVLASHMAGAQTEAWEEGFNDGAHYAEAELSHATYRRSPPANPFTADTRSGE